MFAPHRWAVLLCALVPVWSLADCDEFSEIRMILERNETDGDTELVLFVKGQDAGLDSLEVTDPSGEVIMTFSADSSGVGFREFALESAEPVDTNLLYGTFEKGRYEVSGKSVDGGCLEGAVNLAHGYPEAPKILSPEPDGEIGWEDLEIEWTTSEGATGYLLELENEDTGSEVVVNLPASSGRFLVPAEWITPDSEYQIAVGVIGPNGHISMTEMVVRSD